MDEPPTPPRVPIDQLPPPPPFSAWLVFWILPLGVAITTFFISNAALDNPANGALNGLDGIIAGFFAVIAFVGTLAIGALVRGSGKRSRSGRSDYSILP